VIARVGSGSVGSWLLIGALLAGGLWLVTRMPGESFRGVLVPLTPEQAIVRDGLLQHVQRLAGEIGERNLWRYPALQDAANYIEETLAAIGHVPEPQTFESGGKPVRNIVVELSGATRADEVVVVGAHYDSVPGSPGANDNGSGVAALLEIARLLKDRPLGRTVRLVAFVNEEPPFYRSPEMGSVRYAERARARGDRVTAMLSLETVGYYTGAPGSQRYPWPLGLLYPDTGDFVAFVGNLGSRALVRRAIASFRRHAAFPSEGLAAPAWVVGVGWSDHWSFWQAGFPAIMVTDTAFFRYAHYHSFRDTPERLDYDRTARVVTGLARVVEDLATP
jgi:Zn-dependent M28 family amino/carboxypeptidase